MRFGMAVATLCTVLVPALASGQSEDAYTRYGGWRDRVNINAGAFFVGHDTFALLRPKGTDLPGVEIERQTDIPDNTSDFRMEGYLRLGRRHRLVLGYLQMNRDALSRLQGEIRSEDEVFPIDAQVATEFTYQHKFRGPVVYAILSF
jgi:hypothetical protein